MLLVHNVFPIHMDARSHYVFILRDAKFLLVLFTPVFLSFAASSFVCRFQCCTIILRNVRKFLMDSTS
jgi:hypothetical protein